MKCCNSDDLSHLAGTRCVAPLNQHGWGKCFVRGFPLWRDLAVLDMNLHCFWSLLSIPAYYFYDQRSLLLCETAFQCIFFVILRNYGCYRSWKHLTSIVNEGGKPLNKWPVLWWKAPVFNLLQNNPPNWTLKIRWWQDPPLHRCYTVPQLRSSQLDLMDTNRH